MSDPDSIIQRAIELVETDIVLRVEQASQAGEDGDRGASQTRELLRAYQAGRYGQIPAFLASFIKKAEYESDPEYLQFLKLRRKFGG